MLHAHGGTQSASSAAAQKNVFLPMEGILHGIRGVFCRLSENGVLPYNLRTDAFPSHKDFTMTFERFSVAVFVFLAAAVTALAGTPSVERVVILGFDGADAELVEKWMADGSLPHLAALRESGTYAPLLPPNPPQTPVSWSSFSTGLDPGETNVFDFLRRKEGTYTPTFAMMEEGHKPFLWGERNPQFLSVGAAVAMGMLVFLPVKLFRARWRTALLSGAASALVLWYPLFAAAEAWIPRQVPDPKNQRLGLPMWSALAERGLCANVFRVPAAFPPDRVACGGLLSGLGVPDIRGRVGTPAYYTTDPNFLMDENKFSAEIFELPEFTDSIKTQIYGPATGELFPDGAKTYGPRIDLPMEIRRSAPGEITLRVSGQTAVLREGQWSEWMTLTFSFNPLLKIRGATRFYLLQAEPLKLNMIPVNFHPENTPVPVTSPKEFARDIYRRVGLYKTVGWLVDTWSLDQELIDEAGFLREMNDTVDKDLDILRAYLNGDSPAPLFVHVFEFTDRIGHVFWHHLDPNHPKFNAELAARFAPAVKDAYGRMDAIVGEALSSVSGEKTLFIVVSDHGMKTWRYSINYNTWLIKEGFMTLLGQPAGPKNLEDLFDGGQFFENVDWSRTSAYAMGLGNICVNLRGREPEGSVEPGDEAEAVKRAIIEKLEAFTDPATGIRPVFKVYRREEMYRRFADPNLPDLRAANRPPYRVSWQTSLGHAPEKIFEVNDKKWSADHCSMEPSLLKGIFFCNRKFSIEGDASMLDIYPTVLSALGLDPGDVQGKNLLDPPAS
jgi:predicted AlkP superfamily phosphohydrolase/phosphomutase